MDALGFAVMAVGGWLVYCAVKNVSPIAHAKSVLSATNPKAAPAHG